MFGWFGVIPASIALVVVVAPQHHDVLVIILSALAALMVILQSLVGTWLQVKRRSGPA